MLFRVNSEALQIVKLTEEWSRILENNNQGSITQTWHWSKTWIDVYGKERNLHTLCAYEDGKLCGIAPLAVSKYPVKHFGILDYRTMWFLGSGRTRARGVLSDYLDFIIEKGKEEEFMAGFVEYIKNYPDWDEIILENVSCESLSPELLIKYCSKCGLMCEIVSRVPSILIKLPKTWESFLGSISSGLRYKIKRGREEFDRLGGVYILIKDEKELDDAFKDLETLHRDRWKSKGEPGAFASEEWKIFHARLMKSIFREGWLKLCFLKLNGIPLAANYNFAYKKKIHYFQSGMVSHENKHIRPGLLLHSFCIEEAINEGFEEYDFLQAGGKGAGYKDIWGNYSRDLLRIRISRNSGKEKIYRILSKGLNGVKRAKAWIDGLPF